MNHDADIGTLPAWPELPEGRPRTALDLAAAKLRAALQEGPGYVLVTAENARVSEALFLRIEPDLRTYRTVRFSGRSLEPDAVVEALWKKIEPTTNPPRAAMRLLVDRARASGHPIVVAIADAEDADPAQIEKLRVVLQDAPGASEIVRIALLGGPGLVELLRTPEARALAIRIGASVAVPTASALVNATVVVESPRKKRRTIGDVVAEAMLAGIAALIVIGGAVMWMSTGPALEHTPVNVVQEEHTTPAVVPTPQPTLPAPPIPSPQIVHQPAAEVADVEPAPASDTPPAPAAVGKVEAPQPEAAPTATVAAPEPEATPALLDHELQIGAFLDRERAEALRKQLEARFPSVTIKPIAREGKILYRVRVGGFRSEQDLGLAAAALRTNGYQPLRVHL